jgi:VTC domain-containing protein
MRTLPFADGGITCIRRETKLLLEPEEAEWIARALRVDAAPYACRVAAVYFDSPGAVLARRAASTPDDCVKVRTKAYDPDLGGHAGHVALDVKRERAGLTSKDRLWVPTEDVPYEVGRRLVPIFGPLAPCVASSYRRRVFQCSPAWRVTIDDDLRFHDAGWELFLPGKRPSVDALPPPFGAERRTVVELKHAPGTLPRWLAAIGELRGTPYSKFAAGTAEGDGFGSSRA